MKELLSLVTVLWEEVSRLRSNRESEKEIDWGTHSLPSLRQVQKLTMALKTNDSLLSHHQAERGNPRDGGKQKQVTAQGSRRIHP